MLLSAIARSARGQAVLSGTIRDAQGRPQMGALVELFGPASSLNALTDLQGHYRFRDVMPGIYQLRASATLYLPSVRRQLQLQFHGVSVVNLTLTGLFDESAWISTRTDRLNQKNDWSWTLRSPENRPMLRVIDNDMEAGLPNEQGLPSSETHVAATTTYSSGVFGASGVGESFQVAHRSKNQRTIVGMRSERVKTETGSSASPIFFATSLRVEAADHTRSILAARVETFPQIWSSNANGLRMMELASAERLDIGEVAAVEVGNVTQMITSGRSTLIAHPFLHVATRPILGWTANYAFATSPELSRLGDVDGDAQTAPTVVSTRTGVLTATGLHQQVGVHRTNGRALVRLDYHHDMTRRTAVPGVLTSQRPIPDIAAQALSSSANPPTAYDRSSDLIRIFAPGYSADGFDVGTELRLSPLFSASGTYLRSGGVSLLRASGGTEGTGFSVKQSQAFLVVVESKSKRTGTRVSGSYRWQPSRTMSVVAPYVMPGTEPYLGFHLRQSLPVSRSSSVRIDMALDADDLLGEGYQNYVLAGQSATLASAVRTIRAGVTFSY